MIYGAIASAVSCFDTNVDSRINCGIDYLPPSPSLAITIGDIYIDLSYSLPHIPNSHTSQKEEDPVISALPQFFPNSVHTIHPHLLSARELSLSYTPIVHKVTGPYAIRPLIPIIFSKTHKIFK